MKLPAFGSLRVRLLMPLILVSVIAAIVLAATSSSLGRYWALLDVRDRFDRIRTTLERSSFPLTPAVLQSLADLTDTELITVTRNDSVISDTAELSADDRDSLAAQLRRDAASGVNTDGIQLKVAGTTFLMFAFSRSGPTVQADRPISVVVLFDQQKVKESSRRAAMLPLATGLSTIVLLTTMTLVITGRLVRRLIRLQQSVQQVASGDFDSTVSDRSGDEIGRLGKAVNQMARELKRLWEAVHRQQSAKLVHQIAGGMAHQLRNTLTGSRMAIELHAKRCTSADRDDLSVAIRQMEAAEEYVRRLLMVGSGKQEDDRAGATSECLDDVRSSLGAVAKHLQVELEFNTADGLDATAVRDGPTFSAAVSNLVLNAMHAGTSVKVDTRIGDGQGVIVTVSDNGPGIADEIADEIFEPFVTTKPEGMGLGLPLVQRAAEHLGGQISWSRRDDKTVFEFRCQVQPNSCIEESSD